MVYNALVSSHLFYCDVVWGNCGKTLLDTLHKIQNRGACLINNTPWFSSGKENLDLLNWESLAERRKNSIAIRMYKVITKQVPLYITEKFSLRRHVHDTRQSRYCVNISRPKAKSGKHTFIYSIEVPTYGTHFQRKFKAPQI